MKIKIIKPMVFIFEALNLWLEMVKI